MNEKNPKHTLLEAVTLYSERFGDTYSSRQSPDVEKRFVFCEGNALAQRFAGAKRFVIGELGFGTGLGFLNTFELWTETAPPDAHLEFLSIEAYPLARETITEFLNQFPRLGRARDALLSVWSDPVPGFQRLEFPAQRISLTLIVAEVLDGLRQLEANVDAWYLDGFSPARNPQMWRREVLREVARLSHEGTTFATYTAAGQVRRDLIAAGFAVSKAPGFGSKRERLVGTFRVPRDRAISRISRHFRPHGRRASHERNVIIVGAGVAGCACAHRLAAKGWRVTLLEQAAEPARGTSSNPAAIMQPFLSLDDNIASRFSRQGYLYTLHLVELLQRRSIDCGFKQTGLFSLAKSEEDLRRKQHVARDSDYGEQYQQWLQAKNLSAMPADIDAEGLFFPATGWFDIAALCNGLLRDQRDRIEVHCNTRVLDLTETETGWRVRSETGSFCTSHLILAAGHMLGELLPAETQVPLLLNHGQLDSAPCSRLPSVAISHKGYVAPDHNNGILYFGSTHQPEPKTRCHASAKDRERNLAALAQLSPTLQDSLTTKDGQSWTGVRATTPDHLPLVGELPRTTAWQTRYESWLHGGPIHESAEAPVYRGLSLCTGLGSRAMTSALLSAEILAAQLDEAPLPVERAIFEALHPARYLAREIKAHSSAAPRE